MGNVGGNEYLKGLFGKKKTERSIIKLFKNIYLLILF